MGNVVKFGLCSNEKVREEVAKYTDYKVRWMAGFAWKGSGTFRGRWNAIVEYFIPLKGLNATQCLLKSQYAVKECMKKK